MNLAVKMSRGELWNIYIFKTYYHIYHIAHVIWINVKKFKISFQRKVLGGFVPNKLTIPDAAIRFLRFRNRECQINRRIKVIQCDINSFRTYKSQHRPSSPLGRPRRCRPSDILPDAALSNNSIVVLTINLLLSRRVSGQFKLHRLLCATDTTAVVIRMCFY